MASLEALPFQVRIEYESLTGQKFCRVISQTKSVTKSKQQANEEAKFEVMNKHAKMRAARHA
jgi:hypothetical protein